MSFNIQGSLTIQVKGDDVKFLLYPANAYLSPDKSCAVLYSDKPEQAQILTLKDGCLVLECAKTIKCKDLLSQIALQSKTVALTVSTETVTVKGSGIVKNSITGFTYPASRF